MRSSLALLISLGLWVPLTLGAELKPETVAAFDRYVDLTEKRMSAEPASAFLSVNALPIPQRDSVYAKLRSGEVVIEQLKTLDGNKEISVPDGMIHHWRGSVLIKGTTLQQALTFLKDYDHQAKYYAPDVQASKTLQHDGDEFKVFLRLRKQKIVTVLLNTEYDVKYTSLDSEHTTSRSISTRIAELQDAAKPEGPEKPMGHDNGYLWRLNSYWHFLQQPEGVYVQLEAISLTRDIPTGLGWLVRPFVTSIPKESLQFTLSRTRDALQKH